MIITALLATTAAGGHASMATPPEVAQMKRGQTIINDPMLKRSKDSARMLPYWDLSDALITGIEAMRSEREKFLPRFADEDDASYNLRLRLTKMTNVYADTIDSLASKPFEQETKLVEDENKGVPDSVNELIEDIDGSGNNLTNFAGTTFFNGINSAIDWIMIDHPKKDEKISNMAQYKASGMRPYWSHVLGRNVLDAQSKVINAVETLTYVKIFEPGEPNHIRIFERLETGQIVWRLLEETDKVVNDTRFREIDQGSLTISRIPLVPFFTGRREGKSWFFHPAMRSAADLQVELYQQESGLKYAKTLTAYPMLAANGISPPLEADGKTPKPVKTGPGRVLYSMPDRTTGKVGNWAFVEPSATSLKFLADDIQATIKELRELGKTPLVATMGITVVQAAMGANKAKSAVKAWAYGLKDALENAFVITLEFMGVKQADYDPTVSVFVEFDEFTEGKDLDALQSAREAKDISQETYWDELRRRNVLSAEFDPEVERQRLLEELPGDGEDNNDDDLPPNNDPANNPDPSPGNVK